MRHISIASSFILLTLLGALGLGTEVSGLTYPVGVPTGETAGGTYRTYFDNIFPGCSAGQVIQSFSAVGVPVCVTPTATGFSIPGASLGHTLYYNGSTWVSSANIFNSGGNIGIGTSTPGAKLEVAGQVKITGGAPGNGKILVSDATGLASWVTPGAASNQVCPGTGLNNTCYGIGAMNVNTSGYSNVSLGTNSLFSNVSGYSNTAIGMLAGSNLTSGNNNIFIGYNTQPTAASVSNQLNIGNWIYGSGGNIGIGTNNPLSTLDIRGNITVPYYIKINSNAITQDNLTLLSNDWNAGSGADDLRISPIGNARSRILFSTADGLSGSTTSSEKMSILYNGNVGIGTVTPGAKLEVAGQVKITGGTPGVGKVLTSDAAGLATWAAVTAGSVYATGILGGTQNYVPKFGTGGNGLYLSQIFDNGGNVGIGTVTPGAKLEVAGQVKITGGTPGVGKVLTSDANGLATWEIVSATNQVCPGSGTENTCYGIGAGATMGSGIYNTAIGSNTLYSNTTGTRNTAIGRRALYVNTTGSYNTANGVQALFYNSTGGSNTANGYNSLYFNTIGYNNTANGYGALYLNTSGFDNVANGVGTLRYNTIGVYNTANGVGALFSSLDGNHNVAEGAYALTSNITGDYNVAIGSNALYNRSASILSTGIINASTVTGVTLTQAIPGVVAGDYVYLDLTGVTISNMQTVLKVVNSTTLQTLPGHPNLGITGNGAIENVYKLNATDRDNMVAIGYRAGDTISGGNGTILIGANVDAVDANAPNQLNIGNWIYGSGGNIGIGDTTPLASLDVNRTIADSNFAAWINGSDTNNYGLGVNIANTGATKAIADFQSAGLSRMFIRGDGNIGIGTSTPGAKLEVAGQIKITGGTPGVGKVLTSDATGLATWGLAGIQLCSGTGINNTCYGIGAMSGNTTGYNNLANGYRALYTNTSGYDNTAVGINSLYANTIGYDNTAVGFQSLTSNTTGFQNTANGSNALRNNSSGSYNTAVGPNALFSNTIGNSNTANGQSTLYSNTSGYDNTAVGQSALYSNISGYSNTANGVGALYYNSTGSANTANGVNVLRSNTTGYNNTAMGLNALYANTTGYQNTAIGQSALYANTTGYQNVANGVQSLFSNTTGYNNTVYGVNALYASITGNNNIALGRNAGSNLISGDNNIFIGFNAQPNIGTGASNQLNIGNWLYGNGGNIGIGAPIPSARLHIANGDLELSNTSTGFIFHSRSSNGYDLLQITSKAGGSYEWSKGISLVQSTGNVGIGTTAPGAKLEVAGQVKITGGTPGVGKVLTSDATGLATWTSTISGATATGIVGGSGNYIPKFGTGGTGLYISQLFDNGINVGIGTASPNARLEVTTNASAYGYLMTNNAESPFGFYVKNLGSNGANTEMFKIGLKYNTDENNGFLSFYRGSSTSGGFLTLGSSGAERMRIDPSGNVGIGITSPGAKLEVAGQVKITGGTPGVGKVLTSDATGLATWTSTISGATATGIVGGSGNYIPKFGTGGTGLYLSQLFDNGTNIGIGTPSPTYKLDVYGNGRFTGNLTVSGSLIVDKLVNRTVNNISISGSLLPDGAAPLTYRDIGSNTQRWNNLYLSGQVTIAGGSPGVGKILMSDANGLATWTNSISGATATGITGGSGNYIPKFGTGGTGLYSSVIYQNGSNIAIGTGTATAKLTLDSGITNIAGVRLTRVNSTSTTYTGAAVGLGVDASGNLVPISNGDVVVYDGIGRNGTTPSPNPDVAGREVSYDFNRYFLIPTKQSFVVSDGNGAGYNAPYFKENGTSGLCSWNGAGGTSPYDCATADPYTGLSASPNNSFTMTARGTSYGYQIALGARGDAPLFARSGKWYNSTSNYGSGLYLSDGLTPTPWQKVLTVPANHIEYFYVNIGYNSQLQAISGGGNIGMGTSTPDMRLVLAYSGSTGSTSEMMRIERGLKGVDANMITTFGTPYLLIGGKENRTNSIQTIGFGYNDTSSYQPAEIGLVTTNTAGSTQGDLVFATRSGTTNIAPTERMRIFGNGSIGIGTTTVASRFEVWSGATTIFHMRGTNNIGMGVGSVRSLLSGNANTGFGNESLYTLTTGYSNSAFGHQALRQSTTGYNNSAFGKEAMYNDGDGTWNTALGYQALRSASSSDYNVAIGGQTLYTLGTGTGNVAIGHNALYGATTSTSNNIAIGYMAGSGITTGWNNIIIGNAVQAQTGTASNQLNIGNWIYGNGGNIGIGSTSPSAKLEVAGLIKSTINGAAFLQGGDDSTLNDVNMANTLGIIGIQSSLVGGLQLGSNTGTYIYGSGGNIGIGTTVPGAKLDVNGTFKLGTAGTATTAAGTCTIASVAITTTATAYTCTGVPASTTVALHCNGTAAFTTPGTTALYCRANGTASSVTCNTTVANTNAMTYKCMWMQ